MFSLLSQQVKLLEQLNAYTATELKSACKNITFIIESLNIEVSQLLATRREHGVLLPSVKKLPSLHTDELEKLGFQQLLLEKSLLIQAVNKLCLSEAIVVRNNFSDCLETLAESGNLIVSSTYEINSTTKAKDKNSSKPIVKNNVSPIHLTQIKQRLAEATKSPSEKQIQVKNKLNSLLSLDKSHIKDTKKDNIKDNIKTHVKQA